MAGKLKHIQPEYIHDFGSIDFIAKSIVDGFMSGKHKSPYHGFSVEFAEHRIYNQGDPLKHVDWKLYAKTDRLYLKKYESETNLRAKCILDVSSSMFFPIQEKWTINQPNKIMFSAYSIASIMNLLKKQRDAIGLSIVGGDEFYDSPCKNLEGHIFELYQQLEKQFVEFSIEQKKKTTLAHHLEQIVQKQPKRSVFFIFSDLLFEHQEEYDSFYSILDLMGHLGHEIVIFHTLDQAKEMNFDFGDQPLELFGLEENVQLKVSNREFHNLYQEKMNLFIKELKTRTAKGNVQFIPVDIQQSVDQVLAAYMSLRGLM
jgi:uncharacterized protein (DUF58 family)